MADISHLKERAETYLREGKLDSAKECYLEAIALAPNQAEIYYKLGEVFSLQKSWNQAVDAYCQAIKINPDFSWAYHKLGCALTQLESYLEAVEAYKMAIKLNPEFPWSYHKLGELWMELANWEEAIFAYRRFIKLKPDLFISYKNLGDALMKLSRWDEALAAYQRGLEIEPNSYFANNNLGEVFIKLSRFKEAIAALQKAIENKPNLDVAYYNLGNAFSKLKRWDEAVNAYRRGVEINPHYYWYYHNLGDVLEEKGEFEEAAMAYSRAIELKPDLIEAYKKLKTSLVESEVFEEIIFAYFAQQIESAGWEFLDKLGDSSDLVIKSNIEEAIAYYKDAIEKLNQEAAYYQILTSLPLKGRLYLYLGNIFAREELRNEAIVIYCRGLQLQPKSKSILGKLEKQLSKQEQLKKEVLSSRKALESNPKNFELYYKLGVDLSQLQKWGEAADAYRNCLNLQPDAIDAYNLLGEVLEKQGLTKEAIASYRQAILLQPPRKTQLLTIPANQPIKVKFTDFWKQFPYHNPYVLKDLFDKHYNICLSDDPDFLFYSVFGSQHEKYDCTKIFVTGENRYVSLDVKGNYRRNGMRQIDFRECDFAISHYYLEDSRHYRLPVYLRHWGLEGIKHIKKHKNIEKIMQQKKKFCCFVSSNKRAVKRMNFFRKLNEYKKVDSGGKVLNNIGFLAPKYHQFIKFLSRYKFVIAFENSSTPGYTTEKIFLPMQARSIPIYWGNGWIEREFNPASFVNCHDYPSDAEVIARVIELDNNEELYRQVLAQPYLQSNKIPESFKTKNILQFFDKIFRIER